MCSPSPFSHRRFTPMHGAKLMPPAVEVDSSLLRLFGPAPLYGRPNCPFRPLSVRRRQDCSSPVLSGGDVDCRTRLCIRRSPSQPAAAFPMNGARSVRPWADYARRARQILTLKRENLMIQNLSLAVAMTTLLASNAFAEVHEVQMLNRAADARRAFEPAFLQIAVATPSNS